jgi:3-oxoacyl-[acyl-carrier protein] reductase
MAPLLETPVDAFYELFHSTVAAPFELARGLLDCLKQPGGSIVHVGMAGVDRQRVDPKRSAYTLMKAAQWHLTRALARELAPLGVRCNMVSPGYMENSEDMPESFPVYSKACPVPVQDVVDTVLYLLEDASSHLTGQNLDVAGGIGL